MAADSVALPDSLITPTQPFLGSERDNARSAGAGRREEFRGQTEYEHEVEISGATTVYLREKYAGEEFSIDQTMTLDEYTDLRKEAIRDAITDSITHAYDVSSALNKDALSDIIDQATNLKIPIPPNPLSSIFGKPEISLTVNGEVNVKAGWRWDSQNTGVASAFGQTQSSPVFDQDIKVNVIGQVGDKLKLNVDWNSLRTFEFDNKFKIGFEGEDDDIIKKVELGNVRLNTPSALIQGSQALFGVAADFQFGPLYLKTIASQKRGQSKSVKVNGGALKSQFEIYPYDWSEKHFFLDTAYRSVWEASYENVTRIDPPQFANLQVKEIEVWVTEPRLDPDDRSGLRAAIAYADLDSRGVNGTYDDSYRNAQIVAGTTERGNFLRLDSTQFEYDRIRGWLTIKNLRRDRTYAVAYRTEGPTSALEDDVVVGSFAQTVEADNSLVLQLVYRPNMLPSYTSLWQRWMKNIYELGVSNVSLDETNIQLWTFNERNDSTEYLSGTQDRLVTVLRLDQKTQGSSTGSPDGVFDYNNQYIFNSRRGEIVFPSLEPFRKGFESYFDKLGNAQAAGLHVYPQIYDTTRDIARLAQKNGTYVISGSASGRATNRISLPNALGLSQGSVKVFLNGVPLKENVDYTVEYFNGQVVLRNPQATLPNANVTIEYEQNDVFNLSTKTLVGVRADFDTKTMFRSRDINTVFGMTFMSYDQSLQQDRVQLGDEPVSNSMIGFDGRFEWKADWLTKALDDLPFLDTKAESKITLNGEWAMMLPDPNKKKSDIPDDDGQSVVYVDDFEGSQRFIPLGLTDVQWQHSSAPLDPYFNGDLEAESQYRGKLWWWRYFIGRVPVREVYPNRDVDVRSSNLTVLNVNFIPEERGIYNNNPEFTDSSAFSTSAAEQEHIWGGMQRLLSSYNTNLDADNIDYIEIMMKIDEKDVGTEMFIDLGQISEDIIVNQTLDQEDGLDGIPNGIIDAGEDIGIDLRTNEQERELYPFPNDPDPARDDYSFDFTKSPSEQNEQDFRNYNNFEGNSVSSNGQFPDTEILNDNNGQEVMLDNSFFRYKINLNEDPTTNPQIVGDQGNRWFLYRIPIRGDRETVGNPSFSNVQYVRVWWKGGTFKAKVADWRLSGAQWQRLTTNDDGSTDTTVNISFVSREENAGPPDFYTLPPGVNPPRQIGANDSYDEIFLNEQALSIGVNRLRYGEERGAVRYFPRFDMFYYKKLKFFIHGDGSMPDTVIQGEVPKATAFIRFGVDSLNYYEYNLPLTHPRDARNGWQEVEIDLEKLTAIKQQRDATLALERQVIPDTEKENNNYAIKGYPTLTRIQFVAFGVKNPEERFPNSLNTTMWVNELRLIEPENRSDWSAIANGQIKMADFADVSFSVNHSNPNFHRLEEQFGDRQSTTEWSVNASASLDKVLPKEFRGASLPVSYSHSESFSDPEFETQSDIKVEEAAFAAEQEVLQRDPNAIEEAQQAAEEVRERSQTYIVRDQFAITGVRLGIPGRDWYVRDIFNRMTFGFDYSQTYERSPIVEERFQWRWGLQAGYNITLPNDFTFEPFGFLEDVPVLSMWSAVKFSYLPGKFSTGLNLTRGRTTEQSRYLELPSPVIREFSGTRDAQFTWKLWENGLLNPTMLYNMTARSTLVPIELDENNNQREGSEIFSQMAFNDGKVLDLGEDYDFSQTVTFNLNPVLPPVFGMDQYVQPTGSFSTTYNWINSLEPNPAIQDMGKSANYQNTIRFGFNVRMREMADDWWGIESEPARTPGRRGRGRRGRGSTPKPVIQDAEPADTVSRSLVGNIGHVFKTVFLDYESLTINFNQNNRATNTGVLGGTGLSNFWRSPLFMGQKDLYGPSAAYQMGLISNPHGRVQLGTSSAFPFIKFSSTDGLRPANQLMQDQYTQQTKLEWKANRPLWEGAELNLSFNSAWGYGRNQTVQTDENGIPSFSNITVTKDTRRSYLALPDLGLFGGDVIDVIDAYQAQAAIIEANTPEETERNRKLSQALAQSFEEELESFSIWPEAIAKVMPRVNWSIYWRGLEEWAVFEDIATEVTLNHAYSSEYQIAQSVTDIGEQIDRQSIRFGFSPLIGINMRFDEEALGGNLTIKLDYNTETERALSSYGAATITENVKNELKLDASYTLKEFELPLFGTTFKNDMEFAFEAKYGKTQQVTFDIENWDGEPQVLNGRTNILIEPSARYSLSRRVTARAFFKYVADFSEGANSPGTSTTEFGIDVRIGISGGR